jgi:hypothetical protein
MGSFCLYGMRSIQSHIYEKFVPEMNRDRDSKPTVHSRCTSIVRTRVQAPSVIVTDVCRSQIREQFLVVKNHKSRAIVQVSLFRNTLCKYI